VYLDFQHRAGINHVVGQGWDQRKRRGAPRARPDRRPRQVEVTATDGCAKTAIEAKVIVIATGSDGGAP
jgi:hypothetical protein